MADQIHSASGEDEGASNLWAIFEILSYVLVDAQQDNQGELAERREFALDHAEKLIKAKTDINPASGGESSNVARPTTVVTSEAPEIIT